MSVSWAQLARWDPEALLATAQELTQARQQWQDVRAQLGGAGPALWAWSGVAAGEAHAVHEEWVARAGRMAVEVETTRRGLVAAADELVALHALRRHVEDSATADGYRLDPDSPDATVSGVGDHRAGADEQAGDAVREEITSRARSVLDRAAQIDRELTDLLHRAATSAQDLLTGPAGGASSPPPSRDPVGAAVPIRPAGGVALGQPFPVMTDTLDGLVSPPVGTGPAAGSAGVAGDGMGAALASAPLTPPPVGSAVPAVTTGAAAAPGRREPWVGAAEGQGTDVVLGKGPDPLGGGPDSGPRSHAVAGGAGQPGSGGVVPGGAGSGGVAAAGPVSPGCAAPPGIWVGTDVFLSAGVAAAVAAAVMAMQRRVNRAYQPGSGRRDQLTLPPVVSGLRRAHLRRTTAPDAGEESRPWTGSDAATAEVSGTDVVAGHGPSSTGVGIPSRHPDVDVDGRGGLDADAMVEVDDRASVTRPRRWTLPSGADAAHPAAPPLAPAPPQVRPPQPVSTAPIPIPTRAAAVWSEPPAVPAGAALRLVGVRDGVEVGVDLADVPGLGVVGPAAADVVRGLVVAAAAHPDVVQVVVTEAVAALFGDLPARQGRDGWRVLATAAAVLDLVESEIHTRTTTALAAADAERRWLVVVSPTVEEAPRWHRVLDAGAGCGILGVVMDAWWWPGHSVQIDANATVWATSGGPVEVLQEVQLYRAAGRPAHELLAVLAPAAADPAPTGPRRSIPTAAIAPSRPGGAVEPPIDGSPDRPAIGEVDQLEVIAAPAMHRARLPRDAATDRGSLSSAEAARILAGANVTAAAGEPRLLITVFGRPRLRWGPAPTQQELLPGRWLGADAGAAGVAAPTRRSGPPSAIAGVDAVEVTGSFSPRAQELLALVAVHPDGITREALMATLWPDSSPQRATSALNAALTRLRRAVRAATHDTFVDIVTAEHGSFQLDPGRVVTDYARFATARQIARSVSSPPMRRTAWRMMVDTYTGPLAAGCGWEWIELTRESSRRDTLDAVAALADSLVEAAPEQTLDLLETACGFDPYNELLYRDIMRLQARLGRVEAVPRTLAMLKTRLAELGEHPSGEVRALAQRLCRDGHGAA